MRTAVQTLKDNGPKDVHGNREAWDEHDTARLYALAELIDAHTKPAGEYTPAPELDAFTVMLSAYADEQTARRERMRNRRYVEDAAKDAAQEIIDQYPDATDADELSDYISEWADSATPVYYSDALAVHEETRYEYADEREAREIAGEDASPESLAQAMIYIELEGRISERIRAHFEDLDEDAFED